MILEKEIMVDGHKIFYRECGDKNNSTLVLFHGFPSSSFMFRDLMPLLEDKYYMIAPDYLGFGESDIPPRGNFSYTFDNLCVVKFLRVHKKLTDL